MEVSNMLSESASSHDNKPNPTMTQNDMTTSHSYPIRHSSAGNALQDSIHAGDSLHDVGRDGTHANNNTGKPKTVSFELLVDEARKARARLPMRVQIHPLDSTEDIISSVKGFFGIYDEQASGIAFEDNHGNNITARYENFSNNSTVSVRVIQGPPRNNDSQQPWGFRANSPQRARVLEDGNPVLFPQPAQILNYGQPPSRPLSRVSRKDSLSPRPAHTRVNGVSKSRPRPGAKGQSSSFQAGLDELNDAHNGYSSSDGIAASVSSRKARSEQLATAEISVDNIVEGGRRKRAKFESSELPLFVPPQVPAPNSISSVSPQRRTNAMDLDSPFARPQQRTFTYQVPIQSPQGEGFGMHNTSRTNGFTVPPVPNHNHRLRDRSSGASFRSSLGSAIYPRGANVLPTPDPTVASCISDEDAALQLMRLVEATNYSHGRQSTSTFDDSMSGNADVASSASDNSEEEAEDADQPTLPPIKQSSTPGIMNPQKIKKEPIDNWPSTDGIEPSGDDVDDDYEDSPAKNEGDGHARKKQKTSKAKKTVSKTPKPAKVVTNGKKSKQSSVSGTFNLPMSPVSGVSQSRKASIASTSNMSYALQADEDDLSSKPRCQRCRKSKKGCDRQRPCGRCRDAGIGIEGCISEDECNGRKGRFGRHMGVAIKKGAESADVDHDEEHTHTGALQAGTTGNGDNSKKRKR